MDNLLLAIIRQEAADLKREATTTEIAHRLLEMAETFAELLVIMQARIRQLEEDTRTDGRTLSHSEIPGAMTIIRGL